MKSQWGDIKNVCLCYFEFICHTGNRDKIAYCIFWWIQHINYSDIPCIRKTCILHTIFRLHTAKTAYKYTILNIVKCPAWRSIKNKVSNFHQLCPVICVCVCVFCEYGLLCLPILMNEAQQRSHSSTSCLVISKRGWRSDVRGRRGHWLTVDGG